MLGLRIVTALIKFSLCVGLAGGMVDMTLAMAKKAANAHRVGLVSLTATSGGDNFAKPTPFWTTNEPSTA